MFTKQFIQSLQMFLNDKGTYNIINTDANEWAKDVQKRYDETDIEQFELHSNLTLSGNPELFDYQVKVVKIDEELFETTFKAINESDVTYSEINTPDTTTFIQIKQS